MATEESIVVTKDEVHSFVIRSMEAVGLKLKHGTVLADLIVSAECRGHASHGLNKLEQYMNEIKSGMTSTEDLEPSVLKETSATALVDGNNLIGPYVARFCMDLAIQKAKSAGIGIVSCRGSNHFGTAGWYSLRATEQGLIGMAFTNTSPMLVPTRAKSKVLGTNPLSLGAPAQNGDSFVLDMATTAVAMGKCELKGRRDQPLPTGWAVDVEGHETYQFKTMAGLSPLGGTEESSGYKGYGLAMMVEVLCGVLSGGAFGLTHRPARTHDRPADYGQCFIAIDPDNFAEGFTERMQSLMDSCRNQEPADQDPVLVAGDPERHHQALCDKLGGIPYHPAQIRISKDLATRYKVTPMKPL
ncbi:unnamed protein product [Mytilus edulis]|uniref:Malate dehydrogenase n=1 Tax=Mytilus edulis TaxID=6550 RepID=A0A8S3RZI2_MYTED|nr:unnamed protein product [Mytilus edulis]